MDRERGVAYLLVQRLERIRGVLVVFAEDRPRLLLEIIGGVLEVHEAVGFEGHDGVEARRRRQDVIGGEIVGGERVVIGAELLQDRVVALARIGLRAAEHHVLEEVREAGLPRLDLVARAGSHHGPEGQQSGAIERHRHDLESVVQDGEIGAVREHLRAGPRRLIAPGGQACPEHQDCQGGHELDDIRHRKSPALRAKGAVC